MSKNANFYITTPIYYVNGEPHIGHAYTSVACDVMARFKRLDGVDVKFLTGTDEHGQKVEKSAEDAGLSCQEFVDMVSQTFRDLGETLNLSNDDFVRTTEQRHTKAAQKMWKKLEESGNIYLGKYSGWYSVRDECFYTEAELEDGKAPTGAPVEWVEEESYMFRLSNWQEKLLEHYENNADFIAPDSKRNEVISFVSGGLNDISVSRTAFSWGVPVPDNNKHVMYVWIDALVNYLTAIGWAEEGVAAEDYQKFWPADIHVVGKDILRFHAVYWPAFLMAAGIELPKQIFAHGWWTNEGEKISKSLGNVIVPDKLIATYGLDQTRYFMLREVPFGNDANFSRTAMVNRINSDLANNVGNLVQRTLSMIYKNCAGEIPVVEEAQLSDANVFLTAVRAHIDKMEFHHALEMIMAKSRDANEKIDKEAPWSLKKEGTEASLEKMNQVLYELADEIRQIAIMLQPFTPDAAAKILDQLQISAENRKFENISVPLAYGSELEKPKGVFPRYQVVDVE